MCEFFVFFFDFVIFCVVCCCVIDLKWFDNGGFLEVNFVKYMKCFMCILKKYFMLLKCVIDIL